MSILISRSRLYIGGSWSMQIWGIRIGRQYLTLIGPKSRPLYSERHRRNIKVLPLARGWRIRLRRCPPTLSSTLAPGGAA